MYLVSQDKKNIIRIERVEFSSLFKQYSIIAYGAGSASCATVGNYDTEEQAKAEMNHIIEALNMGVLLSYNFHKK